MTTETDDRVAPHVDVVIVGGGPAGLSAALNLARARLRILLVDAGRPRNAATLRSHGFLTRDGMAPTELRKLAKAELAAYENVEHLDRVAVSELGSASDGSPLFRITTVGRRPGESRVVAAETVLLSTGLRETLPAIPSIRSFYGMSFHSCVECDAWELRDAPIALIGSSHDLAEHALRLARWTHELTVLPNGADVVTPAEEERLALAGIRLERTPVRDIEGTGSIATAVRLVDGRAVPVRGGFVRPEWQPSLPPIRGFELDVDPSGFLATDSEGRTSTAGVYAAGDMVAPGPQQMIIAAGNGARTAAAMVGDLTCRRHAVSP